MKRIKLLALSLAAALLCGCGAGPHGVEDLLRAPQLSGRYSQVQQALNGYLGESAQLKYPATGDAPSPFLFGDWDGDGSEDAAVLYASTSKGQNAHVAILEQQEGGWVVTQEMEGLAPAVESVDTASLEGTAGTQLLVGYGSALGDRYLAVYRYADRTLSTVLQEGYAEYVLEDITGTGVQSLILITPGTPTLKLLLWLKDGYRPVQELELAEGRFTSCEGLYTGRGVGQGRCLVVDGWTGGAGDALASDLLYYDAEKGELARLISAGELFERTRRTYASLRSTDIDGNGRVDIPVQLAPDEGGTVSGGQERRLAFVEWWDFALPGSEARSFGVLDSEYGFYLSLPPEWKGAVMLTEGVAGDGWEVRSLDGTRLYLSLRVTPLDEAPAGYRRAATIGTQQVGVLEGEDIPVWYREKAADWLTLL